MSAAYDQLLLVFRAVARARECFDTIRRKQLERDDVPTGSVWSAVDSWSYSGSERESGMSWTLNLPWIREGTEAWWELEIELDHATARCRVLGSSGFQSGYGQAPLRHVDSVEVIQPSELSAAVDSVLKALFDDVDRDFRAAREAEAAEYREWEERRQGKAGPDATA